MDLLSEFIGLAILDVKTWSAADFFRVEAQFSRQIDINIIGKIKEICNFVVSKNRIPASRKMNPLQ
jgi:hypothetical protein